MVLSARQKIAAYSLLVVDCGLAGSIFVVPLLMGGRHAVGQLALTVFAVAAALAWCLRQCLRDDENAWRPTAALPLLLLAALLLVVQTIPLPPGMLAKLAPRTAEVLPLWTTAADNPARLGNWPYVSFTPAETLGALVIFLDYALLFLVAVQRIRHIEDVERLLRWCAITAVVMAAVGVLQLLFGNGKFLWFYEHPITLASGVAKGTFANRNHFAQFMALGIGPLLWWLQDSLRRSHGSDAKKRSNSGPRHQPLVANRPSRPKTSFSSAGGRGELRTYMLGLALGLVLFAGLLSLSRGGCIAMLLATGICTAIFYRTSAIGGRMLSAVIVAGALIGVSLGIFGYERVSGRLKTLTSGSLNQIDQSAGRRTVWTATIEAAGDFMPLGTGAGSFRKIFPMYTDLYSDKRLDDSPPENSYLPVVLETGAIGSVLLLAGIGLCVCWCFGGIWSTAPTRYKLCAAAIAGSLAASLAHAMVDFIWYVPACMTIVVVLAACAQRIWQMSRSEQRAARDERTAGYLSAGSGGLGFRPAWLVALTAMTLVGGWMIFNRVGPAVAQRYWDEYFVARNVMRVRVTGEDNPEGADEKIQRRWIACLENVVRWSPNHIKARFALAEAHRRLFDTLQAAGDNPMPLVHIRDAAIQSRSKFGSIEALEKWLSVACGEHWVELRRSLDQTLRALSLCPLEGRAYLYLSELSFLRGGDGGVSHACLQQALRARPYDGDVLYAVSSEALLSGDVHRWLDYARRAFRSGPRLQHKIICDLINVTPADQLSTVVDYVVREFQPDLDGLKTLNYACSNRCPSEQLEPLRRLLVKKLEKAAAASDGDKAVADWLDAHRIHNQLGADADALRCARKAVECDPNRVDANYLLALTLMKNGNFVESENILRWCLRRRPADTEVENNLRKAMKGRLDSPRRAAVEGENIR